MHAFPTKGVSANAQLVNHPKAIFYVSRFGAPNRLHLPQSDQAKFATPRYFQKPSALSDYNQQTETSLIDTAGGE